MALWSQRTLITFLEEKNRRKKKKKDSNVRDIIIEQNLEFHLILLRVILGMKEAKAWVLVT